MREKATLSADRVSIVVVGDGGLLYLYISKSLSSLLPSCCCCCCCRRVSLFSETMTAHVNAMTNNIANRPAKQKSKIAGMVTRLATVSQ